MSLLWCAAQVLTPMAARGGAWRDVVALLARSVRNERLFILCPVDQLGVGGGLIGFRL
jgi:hypothetical protein